jgi:hypothetical protein
MPEKNADCGCQYFVQRSRLLQEKSTSELPNSLLHETAATPQKRDPYPSEVRTTNSRKYMTLRTPNPKTQVPKCEESSSQFQEQKVQPMILRSISKTETQVMRRQSYN